MAIKREKSESETIQSLNQTIKDLQAQLLDEIGQAACTKKVLQSEIDTLKEEIRLREWNLMSSQSEKETLEAVYKKRQKENEILKKTVQDLERRLDRKGTGRKRSSTTPDDEVIKLKNQGLSVRAISKHTGLSIATIGRITKAEGVNH